MDIDEEDERNIDDNEIPEKETTELQDSTVDHKFDESRKKSIISMFIYNIYN